MFCRVLTHLPLRPWVTYMSVNQDSISSDNGLSPIGTKPLSQPMLVYSQFGPLGTNFIEILIKIQNYSFTKTYRKISSAKWGPFCPGGDELTLGNLVLIFFIYLNIFTISQLSMHWSIDVQMKKIIDSHFSMHHLVLLLRAILDWSDSYLDGAHRPMKNLLNIIN